MTSIRSFIKEIIGRKDFVTVVSGLPRSGTSMMMSALRAGGMPLLTDETRQADTSNPKGYFEFERVKKLSKGDADWVGNAGGKAVKVISVLLKYLPDTYQYRVIFMEREMDEILASQRRMMEKIGKAKHNQPSEEEIRESLEEHLTAVRLWLTSQAWIRPVYVSYNRVLQQPVESFLQIAQFLNDKVDPEPMVQIVDHSLYREQRNHSFIINEV